MKTTRSKYMLTFSHSIHLEEKPSEEDINAARYMWLLNARGVIGQLIPPHVATKVMGGCSFMDEGEASMCVRTVNVDAKEGNDA